MERDDLLEGLATQAGALADAADGSLDQPVPPCPGWTMADLVWHTGVLHEVWRQTITEHLADRSQRVYPPRLFDAELLDWYRAAGRRLVDVLRATPSEEPCWTWTPPHNVGFVLRRMAHETAIHRWDADGRRACLNRCLVPLPSTESTSSSTTSSIGPTCRTPRRWVARCTCICH